MPAVHKTLPTILATSHACTSYVVYRCVPGGLGGNGSHFKKYIAIGCWMCSHQNKVHHP